MTTIRRSRKKLSPEQVKQLRARAERIDREEGDEIRRRGRAILDHHERMRALLDALIDERKRIGLGLRDVADRTGMARSNLSRLENSTHITPGLDTLERYARAVGKTLRVELTDAA